MKIPNFLAIFKGGKNTTVRSESTTDINAATLAPPPLPKAKPKPVALPGYRTRLVASTSAIAKPNVQSTSLDRAADLRNKVNDYATLRALTKNSPELSSATSLTLRTGIPEKFTLIGRDLDGQVDENATALAHELLRRLTFLGASDGSFGAQQGLQSLSETLAMDLQLSGAMALEVALDKARIPASFNPVAVNTLRFYEEDNSFRVVQVIGGQELDLDIPTFVYVALDQVVTEAYPTSPLTASIQPVLSDLDFNNDIRRALKRAVLPRLSSLIDTEKFKKNTPPEILSDAEAYTNYQNAAIEAVSQAINGLEPEDALVSFDFVTHAYVQGGHDPSTVIAKVQEVLNAKLVSGAKTLPVTLGFTSTASAGSVESLLFIKQADSVRRKLNECYSRALTVAIRLMGVEGYVEFEYDTINLRPEEELEAFKAMRQSRILQLLSLGFMTDAEAGLKLTGHLPPAGFKPLSGTGFMGTGEAVAENPTSNTSNAVEKNLTPDTPTKPKSGR
jgi:hypothetical protein